MELHQLRTMLIANDVMDISWGDSVDSFSDFNKKIGSK